MRRLRASLTSLLFCWSAAATAQAGEPPDITLLRYDEDYSYLASAGSRGGAWWEDLKNIPLDESGAASLTLGGEVRTRVESYQNTGWSRAPESDDSYLLVRALPYADLKIGRGRIFAQIIAAKSGGVAGGPGPADETGIDLLQGFAEARVGSGSELVLRAGRQLLAYGSERLIGTRYGPNVPQPFDGAVASLSIGRWRLDGLAVRPARIGRGSFDDRSDDRRALWSLYATAADPAGAGTGVDLYYIGFENEVAAFAEGSGRELRHTIGSRFFGRRGGWSWDVEAFLQFGSFAGGGIRAWSVASDVKHRWADRPLSPFVELRANIISGDDNAGDGKLQTFNALFPKGKYFGEIGLLGPYNLMNLHPITGVDLGRGFSARAAAVFYWRESLGDGIYGISGRLERGPGGSRERYIGTQSELVIGWSNGRTVELEIAYSRFNAGEFLRDTGPAATVRFLGAEALVRF